MTLYYLRLLSGTVLLFVLSFFLFFVGVYDIKYKKIPNRYILYVGLAGIVSRSCMLCYNIKDILVGVTTITVFLVILVLIFPGSLGGGDIKLMSVCALFLGMNVWKVFVVAVFTAFPVALAISIFGKNKRFLPFGPYICVGVFVQNLLFLYGLT